MRKLVIEIYQSQNLDYIIAPVEADQQLFYLQKNGHADYIVTADLDLLINAMVEQLSS